MIFFIFLNGHRFIKNLCWKVKVCVERTIIYVIEKAILKPLLPNDLSYYYLLCVTEWPGWMVSWTPFKKVLYHYTSTDKYFPGSPMHIYYRVTVLREYVVTVLRDFFYPAELLPCSKCIGDPGALRFSRPTVYTEQNVLLYVLS